METGLWDQKCPKLRSMSSNKSSDAYFVGSNLWLFKKNEWLWTGPYHNYPLSPFTQWDNYNINAGESVDTTGEYAKKIKNTNHHHTPPVDYLHEDNYFLFYIFLKMLCLKMQMRYHHTPT